VTYEEVQAAVDWQAADGRWSDAVLFDARAALNDPTPEEVKRLVLHLGALTCEKGPRGPVALVTSRTSHAKVGRLYARLGDLTALRVQVFDSIEDAEAWLDGEQDDG
jgi:hypothetical protein